MCKAKQTRRRLRPRTLAMALMVLALPSVTSACASDAKSPGETKSAAPKESPGKALIQLAERLEQMYVYPEVGRQYAEYLRSEAGRAQATAENPAQFAARITAALQSIHKDGHLRLEPREPSSRPSSGPGPGGPPPPLSLVSTISLDEGIHYVRLDSLWGDSETMAALASLIEPEKVPDTLILDLRHNRGGGLEEMDFLFSHLFDEPTDLLVMEIRRMIFEMEGGPFRESPNLQRTQSPAESVRLMHRANPAAPPKLTRTRLILLTSQKTGSAAEHLALAVRKTGRGTIFGEATRGAGHFGGMIPISDDLQAFVPAGRTYDPASGKGWEGVGVAPHVAVASDDALLSALKAAGLTRDYAKRNALLVEKETEARLEKH